MFEDAFVVHQCIACSMQSPEISEGDTFLSTKYGWRLSRRTNEKNEIVFEWRCPSCWQRFKASKLPGGGEEEIPSSRQQAPNEPRSDNRGSDPGRYAMVAERSRRGR